MKRLVRDLIRQKRLGEFASVTSRASVFEALNILDAEKRSALLVIDNNQLQGIFTGKDFARASIKKSVQLSSRIESVMTSKVYYAEPTFNLEECLQVMTKVHVRHLPVLENGKPIALLGMRNIVEVLVDDKEAQIRDLTTYITGTSPIDVNFRQAVLTVPVYCPRQVPILHDQKSQGIRREDLERRLG